MSHFSPCPALRSYFCLQVLLLSPFQNVFCLFFLALIFLCSCSRCVTKSWMGYLQANLLGKIVIFLMLQFYFKQVGIGTGQRVVYLLGFDAIFIMIFYLRINTMNLVNFLLFLNSRTFLAAINRAAHRYRKPYRYLYRYLRAVPARIGIFVPEFLM